MLTNLRFLEKGKPFPPESESGRLQKYKANRALFEDEHAEVYKEQFRRIERVIGNFDEVISYTTVFNYQKLMTLKIADFVFGEPPKITVGDEKKQEIINKIIHDTDLYNKLYMSAIDVSRYGDAVMQATKAEDTGRAKIDVISPAFWFPVVNDNDLKEFEYHCFCRVYIIDSEKKKYGLRVQIHCPSKPSVCEEHHYELNGGVGGFSIGKELTEEKEIHRKTGVTSCPVFRISNTPTSDRVFGVDDYGSIDSVVSELEVRVSQISKVLDKFSSPAMSGPAKVMVYNEQKNGYELRFGDYYPISEGDPRPEMIVWDANLDANFKQIEILINQLYTISEMGSAVFGDLSHSAGNVTSGTALRRLMISPLAKARRIANSYDRVIKEMLSVCAAAYGTKIDPTEISIKWNDGLPNDPQEEAELMSTRTGGKATMSRFRALQLFDGMSDSDADKEIAQIDADDTAATMGSVPVNEPEDVVTDTGSVVDE